ncbi:WD40 repeat-like protein, partial [Athelia psychrophila]
MSAGLRRNMCNMTLSVRLTTEVLPDVLAYACQSWVDHVCADGTFGSWAMEKLVAFLRTHLLHWFEAMSILNKSEEIAPMLQRVAAWLEENTFEDKSLKDLVIEAIDFAHKFAAEIAEHPLYVYYTALPLLPSHSILYQLFHDSLVDPSVLLVTNPCDMLCLALSPNGRRIVIGFYEHAIVRDTATGEELAKMENMAGASVLSVAFSYDGSRITCGTHKSTVYVWDSVTGARVIGPLSHSGSSTFVIAVAWSSDGECLLSGCRTGEVILWNITSPNGNQLITKIHHPGCSQHENHLSSLVFSSDGSHFASCSRRGDVHVWNSKTGGIVWSVQDPQGSDPSGGMGSADDKMRQTSPATNRMAASSASQAATASQGARLPYRVKLLCDGHSCYRLRRTNDPGRKSVRGCIVDTIIGIVKQGATDVPGLMDNILHQGLGPKPATKIRRLFSLSKEDD